MGMNTLESLPKLLPKRTHIVLTRQNKKLDPSIMVVHSIDELLDYVENCKTEVMVIGGASIYQQLIGYSNKMLLTEIDATASADAYFPKFNKDDWNSEIIGEYEDNNIKYKHLVYIRK